MVLCRLHFGMGESHQAVIVGTVLEEQTGSILINQRVVRVQRDILLQIIESLSDIPFHLNTLRPFNISFPEVIIQVDAHGVILYCLGEVGAASKDQPSKVEVLWDIILAFLDGLVDVCDSSLELVHVEVDHSSMVEYAGYVVVGELGEVADCFVKVLFNLLDELWLLLDDVSLDTAHCQVQIRF